MFSRRQLGWRLFAVAGMLAAMQTQVFASTTAIHVFAAASLKTALDAIATSWKADAGRDAILTYAASPVLAKQIENGAPADIFMSADLDWMQYLIDRKIVNGKTAVKLLGNRLVLIVPAGFKVEMKIENGFGLAGMIGNGKLAMANTASVPAGKYGKAALEKLGVWAAVAGKVAQAENVRAALKLVAVGEAAAGIVYASDALSDKTVDVVGLFPENSHAAIIYPAAITSASKNPDAAAFMEFLQSAKAGAIFANAGFVVLQQ